MSHTNYSFPFAGIGFDFTDEFNEYLLILETIFTEVYYFIKSTKCIRVRLYET